MMLVLQITIVLGMKILVLLHLAIAPRNHYLVKVFGMAFSLIVVMLQVKFPLLEYIILFFQMFSKKILKFVSTLLKI